MFNIPFIQVPFGYLLDWLYQFTTNYGVALILFSLILKVVLLPMNAKSKKSMLKMSRVAPMVKALEAKYGDDKAKYQQEVMKLYKEEGVSTFGGCLWSFLPLLILIPLYNVIREPLNYLMHMSAEQLEMAAKAVNDGLVAGVESTDNYYWQLITATNIEGIMEGFKSMNFSFLGIDLAVDPSFDFWNWTTHTWSQWGGFVLPILSGAFNIVSMLVSQKLNNSVITNEKGEKDENAAKNNKSMGAMMYVMPLISVWIGFSMPAAITVYWIAQSVFSTIFDSWLTVHYRKVYAKEDAERREKALAEQQKEAERERLRAERRAANPEGITANTSKKKMERKEREEQEAAKKRFEAEKKGIDPDAEEEASEEKSKNCPSGISGRPYARGRAYDPNRYSNNKE